MKLLLWTVVFMVIISITFAPESEDSGTVEKVPPEKTKDFWNSASNVKSASPDQVSTGLSQGVIGSDQLKQLSADQLRPNLGLLKEDQVKALSKDQIGSIGVNNFGANQLKSLSKDQFTQGSFNDLDASKRTSVQPTVRNEIYSQASGVNVEVSKNAKTEDTVIFQDGFEIRSPVDAIRVDDAFVTNGLGVQFRSGVLKVDKADSSLIKEGHLILLEKLEKQGTTIKIDKADEVRAACIRAKNVKDSVFEIKDKVSIKSSEGSSYVIKDCGNNELNYKSTKDNSISISKDTNSIIIGKNVILGNNYNTINISGQTQIDLTSEAGFHCINLSNPSFYEWNRTESSSFRVVPKTNVELCLRRDARQELNPNCKNCVNIDFVNSTIYMNSEVYYKLNSCVFPFK